MPIIDLPDSTATEGSWSRGRRDGWTFISSFRGIAVLVIAAALGGVGSLPIAESGMSGLSKLGFTFLVLLGAPLSAIVLVVLGSALAAPYFQRREARTALQEERVRYSKAQLQQSRPLSFAEVRPLMREYISTGSQLALRFPDSLSQADYFERYDEASRWSSDVLGSLGRAHAEWQLSILEKHGHLRGNVSVTATREWIKGVVDDLEAMFP